VGTNERAFLTSVSQIDPVLVEFPVSEQEYLGLRSFLLGGEANKGPSLELILADGTTYLHRGAIDIIGREVSPSTATLRIRGLFENPGNVLRPGQYAKIRAATSVRKAALLLPRVPGYGRCESRTDCRTCGAAGEADRPDDPPLLDFRRTPRA
jgi:multidrug efflux pump subunit AcrA (membrane-fusion protein)